METLQEYGKLTVFQGLFFSRNKLCSVSRQKMLQEHGYVVIPAFGNKYRSILRKEFIETCQSFPEYKKHENLVLGGFAALANAASFHNPFVRKVRLEIMKIVESLKVIPMISEKHKLAQIIDRMLYRKKGQTPTRESWHRDESKKTLSDDVVYGGWVNFDSTSQYFSCVPGSHRAYGSRTQGGFVMLDPQTVDKSLKKMVEIKPGNLLIFDEDLVHEVLATACENDMCRLFIGWLVTRSKNTIIPEMERILQDQAVVPLKSGQIPPMYAKLHWTNWHERLIAFSEGIVDDCVEEKERKGITIRVVLRHMKSLSELGVMYPPYEKEEKDILYPHRVY